MKIAAISDTHEKHNYINNFPEADVFVFAGDVTMRGENYWLENFNNWLGELPYKYKLVIAGNHDRNLDLIDKGDTIDNARKYGQEKLINAIYLLDEGFEINGVKFWGSPYTPFFASEYWKFHYHEGEAQTQWDKIPVDTDVLITHGPAKFHGDRCLEGDYAGCFDLAEAIRRIKPKVHIFGHIHEDRGVIQHEDTLYCNVSAVDRKYNLRNDPWTIIELK